MANAPTTARSSGAHDAASLAERLGGRLFGDGSVRATRIDTLEDAGQSSVAWITSSQDPSRVARSAAAILVIPEDFPPPAGRCSIAVKDPEIALCDLLELFDQTDQGAPEGVHPTAAVHPTARVDNVAIGACAVVEKGASVGPGTVLHAGAYVGANVRIGQGCVIWNNVVIRAGSTLGDRVIIHPNAAIGADGFGYIFRAGRHVKVPQVGGVVIEDDVEIGAGSAVDRAKTGVTRIGQGTKIDNLCQIAHNVQIGRHCVIAGGACIGGSCVIGDYCAIGGQAAISDHVTLETGARVAGLSGATRRVLPHETVRGCPAVNIKDFERITIAGRRLPAMMQEFKAMQARIAALEARLEHTGNRAGGDPADQAPAGRRTNGAH